MCVKINSEELFFLMLSRLKIHIILVLDRLRMWCVARVTCLVSLISLIRSHKRKQTNDRLRDSNARMQHKLFMIERHYYHTNNHPETTFCPWNRNRNRKFDVMHTPLQALQKDTDTSLTLMRPSQISCTFCQGAWNEDIIWMLNSHYDEGNLPKQVFTDNPELRRSLDSATVNFIGIS